MVGLFVQLRSAVRESYKKKKNKKTLVFDFNATEGTWPNSIDRLFLSHDAASYSPVSNSQQWGGASGGGEDFLILLLIYDPSLSCSHYHNHSSSSPNRCCCHGRWGEEVLRRRPRSPHLQILCIGTLSPRRLLLVLSSPHHQQQQQQQQLTSTVVLVVPSSPQTVSRGRNLRDGPPAMGGGQHLRSTALPRYALLSLEPPRGAAGRV